jgi:hypothetical protein
MLSIGRTNPRTTPVATGGWAELLGSEEDYAAKQGFGAGVLLVHYAGELLRFVAEDDRAITESAILAIIDRHLGWTDRTAPVAAGRLGVVVIPVDGALALSRRARELHRDLRACGLDVDVAYSFRRRSGGLQAAAARADAALDTALSRRASHRP